jgi:hypothetical protein
MSGSALEAMVGEAENGLQREVAVKDCNFEVAWFLKMHLNVPWKALMRDYSKGESARRCRSRFGY